MNKGLEERYRKNHTCRHCNALLLIGINYRIKFLEKYTYECIPCVSKKNSKVLCDKRGFVKKQQPPKRIKTKLFSWDNPYSNITPNLFTPSLQPHLYKRVYGKKCLDCDVSLVLGDNITPSHARMWLYVCRDCNAMRNHNKRKRNVKDSTAGIYGLYDKNHLVYIGESKACEMRWRSHFSGTAKGSKSDIGWDRDRRHDYEFRLICEEDNLYKRLAIEMDLVVKYKPRLNYPYKPLYDGGELEHILGSTHEDLLKKGF